MKLPTAHIRMLVFLALSFFCSWSGTWAGPPSCIPHWQKLKVALEMIMFESVHRSWVYCSNECYFNSGELARIIQKAKDRLPEMDPGELKIAVIKHKDYHFTSSISDHQYLYPHGNRVEDDSNRWRFHSFLVYKGQVLDLDLEKLEITDLKSYVNQMLHHYSLGSLHFNRQEDFVIQFFPTQEYLNTYGQRPGPLDVKRFPPSESPHYLPLQQYLK